MPVHEQQRDERLESIRRKYRVFGWYPALYAAQDWITFLGRPGRIRRLAVEAMEVVCGARVLEIASGTGRNFPYIEAAIGPEGVLVALEYAPEMLESARHLAERNGWRNVRLIQGDAAALEVGVCRSTGPCAAWP